MCGRYGLYDIQEFGARFELGAGAASAKKITPNWNAAPGQMMPVVIGIGGARQLATMKWGLVPFWAKDDRIGYKMINARAESIFDKPAWREQIKHHRCLVPANAFYEWKRQAGQKTKQPYMIYPADSKLFAFAGLFSTWRDPSDPDAETLQTYSIITTSPNREMQSIHDRMPVILDKDSEGIWLDDSLDEKEVLAELLRPLPDGSLQMHEVSTDVNLVKNNDGYLIEPINSK
jgi:putative SOS response-associated peptidase YedK